MPKRKKKRRKGGRYHRGTFVSSKMPGRQFNYRSGWEEAYLHHLESNPEVASYDYECLKIPYISNLRTKKVRHYMPDFVVNRPDGVHIVEIKPSRFLHKLAIVKKLAAGKQYADNNGMKFDVLTEVELRAMSIIP